LLVANGTRTTEQPENAKCKKLAKACVMRIRRPADPTRKEPVSQSPRDLHVGHPTVILQDVAFAPRKDH